MKKRTRELPMAGVFRLLPFCCLDSLFCALMAGDEWRERCLVVFYDYRGKVACRGLSSRFGGKQTKTNRGCEAGWLAGWKAGESPPGLDGGFVSLLLERFNKAISADAR
jgi:hypothetical protein